MLNFNVGPSKISQAVQSDIVALAESNTLEYSHRSPSFSAISKRALDGLRKYFNVPADYKIFYTSSATEAIELSVANTCGGKSFHFLNGFFSNLSYKASEAYGNQVIVEQAELGLKSDFKTTIIPEDCDYIGLAYCETSTGVSCQNEDIKYLKENNPQAIVMVDVTSIAGGVEIDLSNADIWCFSVQKCLGLPSGLGLTFVSPKAYERSLELQEQGKNNAGLFSYQAQQDMMVEEKYFTIPTSNIFVTSLLANQIERYNATGGLTERNKQTEEKYRCFSEFINNHPKLTHFVENEEDRSRTIFVITGDESYLAEIQKQAKEQHIILGVGLGQLEGNIIRIANFPSHSLEDIKALTVFLNSVS